MRLGSNLLENVVKMTFAKMVVLPFLIAQVAIFLECIIAKVNFKMQIFVK